MADLSNEEAVMTKAEIQEEISSIEKAFAVSTAGYAEMSHIRIGDIQHDREVMLVTAKRILNDETAPSYKSQMFQLHLRHMRQSIVHVDDGVAKGQYTR